MRSHFKSQRQHLTKLTLLPRVQSSKEVSCDLSGRLDTDVNRWRIRLPNSHST